MSRHAQLPPRCPLQRKVANQQHNTSFSPPLSQDYIDSYQRKSGLHKKSISQSFVLDQPEWLNDLLNDEDADFNGTLHLQAARDSLTPYKDHVPLHESDHLHETEPADSFGTNNVLDSTCTYGPNSPRKKDNLEFPERKIASAFSEYPVQNMKHLLEGCNSLYASVQQADSNDTAGEGNDDQNKLLKRHPGQRSRARKLQYIAELERTVDIIQNMGSDLSIRVASLLQKHKALSIENSTLKQQLLRVQQEKYVVDGEYRLLKNEVERLRSALPISSKNKMKHNRSLSSGYLDYSDAIWDVRRAKTRSELK